jgi:hypothetical protein
MVTSLMNQLFAPDVPKIVAVTVGGAAAAAGVNTSSAPKARR